MPEAWLEGPVDDVSAPLMPVAHSLLDALRDVESAANLDVDRLWARPAGAASVGFHLRHMAGAIDRLLTYARGEQLTSAQLACLRAESDPGEPPADGDELMDGLRESVTHALDQLRATPDEVLLESRAVGRLGLPSNVLGLLFHAAEHTRRHAGQLIVTERVVRAESAVPEGLDLDTLSAALHAWDDAGVRGLCTDGRLEAATDALRSRGIRLAT